MPDRYTITVTAKIVSPLGETIFFSSHNQALPPDSDNKLLFQGIVSPMERVLSDAHKQFALPPTDDEPPATEPTTPAHE
jgi:hypothetical protein